MASTDSFDSEQRKHLMRILPVFATILSLIAGLHFWLAYSVSASVLFPPYLKALIWTVLIAGYLLLPLGMFSNRGETKWLPGWVGYLSFTWLGIFWIWISMHSFFSIVSFLLARVLDIQFPAILASTSLGFILGLWSLWTGFRPPRIHHVSVPLESWPQELNGLKIVQLSDVHTGMLFVDDRFLEDVVQKVNAQNPDIVVITGDLIEGPPSRVRELLRPLKNIKSKYGRFYVTGNHEYYYGGSIWENIVADLGWTVLSNRHEILQINSTELAMVGVTDFMAGGIYADAASDPQKAFKGIDKAVPRIFLAHEPRSLLQALPEQFDLQLSGHTHGGQIFPLNLLVYTQQPTNRGLEKLKDRWIFTHMGTGFWGPPMRLGTYSEIAVLEIKRSGSDITK